VTSSTTEREASKEGVSAANARQAAQATAKKRETFAKLEGAITALKSKGGDKPAARAKAAEAASLLGIPPSELDSMFTETTGDGLFNLAEPEKVQAILNKYNPDAIQPGAPGAPAAPAALPSGQVRLRHPINGMIYQMSEAEAVLARKAKYTDVK
jgi:hypothetical protein